MHNRIIKMQNAKHTRIRLKEVLPGYSIRMGQGCNKFLLNQLDICLHIVGDEHNTTMIHANFNLFASFNQGHGK